MVGPGNPFHAQNKPPAQHIVPEIITVNPCKLDMKGADTKKIPFSGKLGVLGQRILNDYRTAG